MPTDPDSLLEELHLFGVRLGLDSCHRLLEALGAPQRSVPTVLVAGTNGKGSTAALLAAMGSAGGYRTGLYTSPHLESVEERIRLDGATIPRPALASLLEEILTAAKGVSQDPITYFEALTVAAYLYFARQGVDLAVLEVGLGGRLDATNAGEPILSVITAIGLDHQEHLGETLGEIAREKAGILRQGVPAVCWIEEPEALDTVRDAAREIGAPLTSAPEEVRWESHRSLGWGGQEGTLITPRQRLRFEVPLLGEHQLDNLGLAVRAAETLGEMGFSKLDGPALERGATAVRWPGRLEVMELPDGRRVLLDAAHNAAAAAGLRRYLDGVDGELDLLFGILTDKDAKAVLGTLAPRFRRILLTRPASSRSRDPEELLGIAGRAAGVEEDLEVALDRALGDLAAGDSNTLVVCGSIYLVGAVRGLLRRGAKAAARRGGSAR